MLDANQVEISFSVVQGTVVSPDDFPDLAQAGARLQAFEDRYNTTAQPYQWRFTTSDLDDLPARLDRHASAIRHSEKRPSPCPHSAEGVDSAPARPT